jgi:hypothetical protein
MNELASRPFRKIRLQAISLIAGSVFLSASAAFIVEAFAANAAFAKSKPVAEQPLMLRVLNYEAFNAPDLQTYMVRMKESIRARWHPKGAAPHATKIFFQILGDGSLMQHSIQDSSGDSAYDNEANSVIESLAPFGTPPPGSIRLMNILAVFGVDDCSSNPSAAQNSGAENPPNGSNSYGTAGGAAAGSSSGNDSSTRPPLEGQASETGVAQPKTKLLTGEASAEGQGQPLQAETSMNAPPPMYQGQAMAQAPPMFQAQTGMQAPPPMYNVGAQHGQMTIGVLGCEFGMLNNQIRQILPGSDLLRYGFQVGDIIEAADGQRLRGKDMQAYIRGTPGTYVQLTVLHQGQMVTVPVMRKDTRMFQSYSGYFRKWAGQEKFW